MHSDRTNATTGGEAPRVSVVVPVYNTAPRLFATLESLRTQNLRAAEFILVDDGSTDGSLDVCREFAEKDPRFRVLTGPNGGVCVARNRGLDAARGEWIAFCDSDDRVHPDIYTTLLELADVENVDLACCAMRDIGPEETQECVVDFPFVGEQETIRGRKAVFERALFPFIANLRSVNGYLFVCLFRRDLIEARRIRFCPGITMFEDETFLMDYLLTAKSIAIVRKCLYDYIRFATSACSKFYRREGDFKREYNWFLRARERERIFHAGGFAADDPTMAERMQFMTYYHEAQAICCNRANSWSRRLRQLYKLRRRVREMDSRPPGTAERLVRDCLLWFTPALPLLLWLKRRKDEAARKIEHAVK
jgi:glycosyltransferase involved in cell wall biosynthesis